MLPADIDRLDVLIVDDNRDGAVGMANLLQLHGYTTAVATDARSARKFFARDPLAALVDYRMFTVYGDEVIRELVVACPGCKAALITAATDVDTAGIAKAAGAVHSFEKTGKIDPALDFLWGYGIEPSRSPQLTTRLGGQ